MDRRKFSKTIIEAVASYALLQTLFERNAFAREIRPVTDRWITDLHEMAMDVRSGRITPREWQDRIKVEEDETYMVILPTVDEIVGIGTYSSISDEHNNVHWLRALTQTAFTFDVIVVDVNGGQWEVDNIDPYAAEDIGGGLIRAPKLDVATALEKYGHESHH